MSNRNLTTFTYIYVSLCIEARKALTSSCHPFAKYSSDSHPCLPPSFAPFFLTHSPQRSTWGQLLASNFFNLVAGKSISVESMKSKLPVKNSWSHWRPSGCNIELHHIVSLVFQTSTVDVYHRGTDNKPYLT